MRPHAQVFQDLLLSFSRFCKQLSTAVEVDASVDCVTQHHTS